MSALFLAEPGLLGSEHMCWRTPSEKNGVLPPEFSTTCLHAYWLIQNIWILHISRDYVSVYVKIHSWIETNSIDCFIVNGFAYPLTRRTTSTAFTVYDINACEC